MTNSKDFNDEVNEAFKDELNQGYEKSKRKRKQNENAKTEYIQKLSNEKALAEAIIIGNKPCFVVVDYTNESPIVSIIDSLAYDENTQFKPEQLNNRPYSFRSKQDFDDYVGRAKNETLDSLFDKTRKIWNKYIDASDLHLDICAADTMFSYKQDVIGSVHYLFFIADNDAGKSNNLSVFNVLAYRNLMSTSMTYSNVYTFLGIREEGVGTLCIDEADKIDQNPELMSILKPGYTKGTPVLRNLDTVHGRKQQKLNTYCFKAFAGERLPDAIDARGFMQRTIVIKCLPGYPEYDISEVLDPAGDEEFEALRNELFDLRNLLFCYFRVLHFKDKVPNIKLNIRNREKQLFKPLLRMFRGTRTSERLKPVISEYIRERRKNKTDSFHAFLYKVIRDLIESTNCDELQSSKIWEFIKLNLEEWKDIPFKPQSIDTMEFGVLSLKGVITTLKEVFHAEPPKHKGSTRSLVFSKDAMDRMRDTYDIDIEVEILEGDEVEAHEAHEAHSGNVGLDNHIPNDREMTRKTIADEVQIEANNHKTPPLKEGLHVQKAPQAPQAPLIREAKPKLYFSYGKYHCESCNQKGDKFDMEDHECNGKKELV